MNRHAIIACFVLAAVIAVCATVFRMSHDRAPKATVIDPQLTTSAEHEVDLYDYVSLEDVCRDLPNRWPMRYETLAVAEPTNHSVAVMCKRTDQEREPDERDHLVILTQTHRQTFAQINSSKWPLWLLTKTTSVDEDILKECTKDEEIIGILVERSGSTWGLGSKDSPVTRHAQSGKALCYNKDEQTVRFKSSTGASIRFRNTDLIGF